MECKRSVIFHKSYSTHTCTLLKCRNDVVAQNILPNYPFDINSFYHCDTSNRTSRINLLGKEWPYDKRCNKLASLCYLSTMKMYWFMCDPIFRCPYFACESINMPLEMELGFVCAQSVPWPFIFHFPMRKQNFLEQKFLLLADQQEATSELG